MPTSLDQLNATDRAGFVAAQDGIYDRSPWVAERALSAHPFATVADLADATQAVVAPAAADAQLAPVQSHRELAGKLAGSRAPATKGRIGEHMPWSAYASRRGDSLFPLAGPG